MKLRFNSDDKRIVPAVIIGIFIVVASLIIFMVSFYSDYKQKQIPAPEGVPERGQTMPEAPTAPDEQIHLECQNKTCVQVSGAGNNLGGCINVGQSCGSAGGGSGGSGGGTGGGTTGGGTAQCSDGIDNDNDQATDFPNDFSCSDASDNDEASPKSECQDTFDNDNDTFIDYPNDNDCTSFQDNSELGGGATGQWEKINGENPVDVGLLAILVNFLNRENEIKTVHDNDGNLFYLFATNDKSTYAARFMKDTKSWEFFSFNGWTSNSDEIPRPITENKWVIADLSIEQHPLNANEFIGTMSAVPTAGVLMMDIHAPTFGIKFDNNDFLTWTPTEYSNTNAQVFSFSVGSGSNDFAVLENFGVAILQIADFGEGSLGAARYNPTLEKWENWVNGNWSEPPVIRLPLNEIKLPFLDVKEEAIEPIIKNIPGTKDFIITYVSASSDKLRAAKYNDETQAWEYWGTGGWNKGKKVDLDDTPLTFIRRGPSFVIDNKLYMLFNTDTEIKMGIYDHASPSWSISTIASGFSHTEKPAHNFVAAQNGNTIWLVYKKGDSLFLQRYNGNWSLEQEIYNNMNILPHAIEFVDSNPVLFVSERVGNERRIYAISDKSSGYWANENPRIPKTPESPKSLDIGAETSQWDTKVEMSITNDSQTYVFPSAYGTMMCGHMEIDSERKVYCPKVVVNNLCIFPHDYTGTEPEQANCWGGFWDYFFFPSGVGVANQLDRVYVTDIVPGLENNAMPNGQLQIWDKGKNGEDVAYVFVLENGTHITVDKKYFPTIITTYGNNEKFNWPTDVAVDELHAFLYVTESRSNRILKFSIPFTDPQFLGAIEDGFKYPQGIDTDNDGNLYVVDTNNHRIVLWKEFGQDYWGPDVYWSPDTLIAPTNK